MDVPLNEFEESGLNVPGHLYLQFGSPGPGLLKKVATMMKTGMNLYQERHRHEEALQYGCLSGNGLLRLELAKFLTRQYGQVVERDDIFITNGATGGLDSLMKHFFTRDHVIFVENPTYQTFARHVVNDDQMRVVPIAMRDDGADMEELEKSLESLPPVNLTSRRPFRAAMYVIAIHHNPTGICYSPEKCRKLVKLARKYEMLVICDDVYNVLNYVTDPVDPDKFKFAPQRLFAYDNKQDSDYKGHIVANGSFSKFAGPGLRLGWYELPKRLFVHLEDSYFIESASGMMSYSSTIMTDVLSSGMMDEHVQIVRKQFKVRMEKSISIIQSSVSKYGVKCSQPSGGCFLWVEMPEEVTAEMVFPVAQNKEHVSFIKGEL
uniref:Uncharacterized protein YER152C n=1 Tax=Phallusia mammillata TaxID=59560 RepID=A0A6F9D572_9ASCI|nr:uncharacterized protein YER152C [Phallusia mammillata]